jgi:hypothetical protein
MSKANASKAKQPVDKLTFIQKVVNSLSRDEKSEILTQMKQLIDSNEKGAKDLLLTNTELAQALLLIELDFDLVTTENVKTLPAKVNGRNPVAKPPPAPPAAPTAKIPSPPKPMRPTANRRVARRPTAPTPAPQSKQGKIHEALAKLTPEQREQISKILKLSPADINKLAPNAQQQISNLKSQLGIGGL